VISGALSLFLSSEYSFSFVTLTLLIQSPMEETSNLSFCPASSMSFFFSKIDFYLEQNPCCSVYNVVFGIPPALIVSNNLTSEGNETLVM
jgi:hypothetical protein